MIEYRYFVASCQFNVMLQYDANLFKTFSKLIRHYFAQGNTLI